jgi:hypothetical protein
LTQRTYSREYGLNDRVARRTVYNIISFKLMVQSSSTGGKGTVVGDAVVGEMTDTLNKSVEELIREGTPTNEQLSGRWQESLGDVRYITVHVNSLGYKAKP